MIDINELKQQLLNGTFYYYKSGLYIISKVNKVAYHERENNLIEISFNGGNVEVFVENIKRVRKPSNVIGKFKYCYSLKNEDNEYIGYIGKNEEGK